MARLARKNLFHRNAGPALPVLTSGGAAGERQHVGFVRRIGGSGERNFIKLDLGEALTAIVQT
jgi:hypothetical protein